MTLNNILKTAGSVIGKSRPIVLYHKPTDRCECRCVFCNFWKKQPAENDVLPTENIISMLDNAREAGFAAYSLWGGEPLMVEPLPEYLQHAKKIGLRTIMCTAGSLLKERSPDVAPNVDHLLLSMEATGESLDKIRGYRGLFERVLSGLDEFKRHSDGEITIWCNVGRHNKEKLEDIAQFALEKDINVEFFPTFLFKNYNENLILNKDERFNVFSRALELKKEGFPILNNEYALKLMRDSCKYRCNMVQLSIHVIPDGSIYPCESRIVSDKYYYGNIKEVDLKDIKDSDRYKMAVKELSQCNKCLLPCVAQTADNLLFQGIRRLRSEFKR